MLPLTYPARPVQGGPLPGAPAKTGEWYYEPKVNEERALLHVPTGTLFNRHGQGFSKTLLFGEALATLRDAIGNDPHLAWLDCGAFGFRHKLGLGSLLIFDAPACPGTWKARQALLQTLHGSCIATVWRYLDEPPPSGHALLFPSPLAPVPLLEIWNRLQTRNRTLGVELFEGLVAKRADGLYPIQLLSPAREFPGWVKHRWAW